MADFKKTENAFLGNLSNMAAGYDTPPSRAFLLLSAMTERGLQQISWQ